MLKLRIFFTRSKTQVGQGYQRLIKTIDRKPFASFIGLLILLFLLVVIGSRLRQPAQSKTEEAAAPKQVELYTVGDVPQVSMQASIEKSGVVTLVAQTSGVVQKISKHEGDAVNRGTTVVTLSTNYQGGNAAAITRKIAQTNAKFLKETFDAQKDLLNKQRELARKGDVQANELRSISRQSFDDTSSLISLNEDIVRSLDQQIAELEATNVGGVNDSTIILTKQSKSQSLSALSGLRSSLRTLQYQTDTSKEPAQISDLQRDVTLQQLDLQEKSLNLNKDLSSLNVKLAQITESLMYPASPYAGTVERIYVKVGQAVNPGTVIASIRGKNNKATAVLLVSSDLARQISRLEPSVFSIDKQQVKVLPTYVSTEPTSGTLHSVLYHLPDELSIAVSQGTSVSVSVPISEPGTKAKAMYVPLDAVYQTQDAAYVYIVGHDSEGKAIAEVRSVKLDGVDGQYVQVLEGISADTQVIVNRNILAGEAIAW